MSGKNLDSIVVNLFSNKDLNENYLIQPNKMYQFWEYPKLAKIFSNFDKKYIVEFYKNDKVLNSKEVKNSLLFNSGDYNLKEFGSVEEIDTRNIDHNDSLKNKWIFWVLNCGNFIVNKNIMSQIAKGGLEFDRSIRSVDAIAFSYLWLESGREIKIIKKFFHHHRKREDSVSFTEKKDSKKGMRFFIKKVLMSF